MLLSTNCMQNTMFGIGLQRLGMIPTFSDLEVQQSITFIIVCTTLHCGPCLACHPDRGL